MNLLDKIYQAGVVGAGGAGFPTHVKLDCEAEYLIINGAECEPLLQTDQYIMRTEAVKIIRAVEKAAKLIQADKVLIGLKKKYQEEIASLKAAIEKEDSAVELYYLDNFYPAGDEQILAYEITGRSVPLGGIPLDIGVVVSNVGTVMNIHDALEDRSVTEKYVSILGEVEEPGLIKAPIGTTVKQCIEAAGGAVIDNFAIILGGPMMGQPISQTEIGKEVISKTDGAIIVIPAAHYLIKQNQLKLDHIINQTKSACIQCSYCTDFCPRYLIGHSLEPHKVMRSIAFNDGDLTKNDIFKQALLCCECGVCELYACPMGLSPRQVNIYVKNKLAEEGIRYEAKQREISAVDNREYRKIPVQRLIARIDVTGYVGQQLADIKEIKPLEVSVPLLQHIGAPAEPVVEIGDIAKRGDIIGRVDRQALGANIHASISGKVTVVSDKVVIKRESTEVIS